MGLSKSLSREACERAALATRQLLPQAQQQSPRLVADKLRKPADLRDAGVLSEEQFSQSRKPGFWERTEAVVASSSLPPTART